MNMSMSGKTKRNDIILIAALLLAGIVLFFVVGNLKDDGGSVQVQVSGKIKETYSLNKDQVIDLNFNGYNKLAIEKGKASVTEADCPDKLCTEQRAISKQGETIVCLPHKTVIKVSGGKDSEIDGVVK